MQQLSVYTLQPPLFTVAIFSAIPIATINAAEAAAASKAQDELTRPNFEILHRDNVCLNEKIIWFSQER